MKKFIKLIFKLVIIVVVLLAVLKACLGKEDKPEPKQIEPQTIEKKEEPKPQEEKPQEIVEEVKEIEQEEIEDIQEEEDIDNNSIRPEFKKSMEDYEIFFDEYIEFLNAFKKDSTSLSMLTEYAEFMSKYEKAMSELDSINESELTDAENKLFLETQLRISNKLSQLAINY